MTFNEAYKLVAEVASPSDSEGLEKERAILLLWFLRHVHGIDDLEAYEFICDGDDDQGIDGAYLEPADADEETETLLLFQSRYPTKPKNVGVTEIRKVIGSAEPFLTGNGLESLLADCSSSELSGLMERFDAVKKLKASRLLIRVVFVTSGKLTPQARKLVKTTNENREYPFLKAYDVLDLAPIVQAFRSPTTVSANVVVPCDQANRFICTIPGSRVAVCNVAVKDIVNWPGIVDRSLFDLNVRRELGKNQVRKALDRAIRKQSDHPNFIAYHNGLTVVCRKINDSDSSSLMIDGLSVVNGAQSTIAFKDNEDMVTDELSVVVKFVEVPPERQLAREVAIRSNTQNPVNARNLRARDGIQLRLVSEFEALYSDVTYEIRPDASLPKRKIVIQNDDAAQLLCAVYNQTPWVAIRRLSLFDAARYPTVFTPDITAGHVMIVNKIAITVQIEKDRFPQDYVRSWRLTKLVAVYLVGQMLRTSDKLRAILDSPNDAITNKRDTEETIDRLVKFAAATLKTRCDERKRSGDKDDFKVDFKRENALRDLAGKARDSYLTYATVEGV